jgi:hypothetical protein
MAVFTAALLGGTLLGSTFLATAAAAALNLALGFGVQLAITSLMPKPEQPQFSIQGKLQAGDDTPRAVPVGYTATAGSLVYANTWGKAGKTKNAYLTQVIALADVPISGLAGMWVGEQKITLPDMTGAAPYDQGWPIEEYKTKGSNNHLWIRFYDGTQTTADSFLVNSVSSADRPYESTRVGRGVAYAVVTSQVAESLFTGLPSFRFELNGARLYDITKDGSAGGVGLQRWADPSTWGGDGDMLPAVQMYNVLRGVRYGSQWLYGAQNMPEGRLPRAGWIAAINACRAPIANGDGTEPSYRSGTEIRVSTAGLDALKVLQDACLGHLAEVGGIYTLHVGEPAAASFTITDDDVISTEEQIFTPFAGLADTVNGITAKYPSPADAWNSKTAPPLFSSDFEAEDGNRRLISDLSLDAVPYDAQVQRIMKAALAEARRSRRHTMVLPPKFWRYAVPNETFSYTSARNGYTTKRFRIDGAGDKANLDNTVNVTEVDPTDFAWNHSTDFTPVSEGSLGSPTIPPQPFIGWNAFPAVVNDADGKARRPAIGISFPGDLDDVQFVRVQVRLPGATALQFDGAVPYGDPATNPNPSSGIVSFASILPKTAYEVRGILVPYSGREALWSNLAEDGTEGAWLGVTTDDIRFGPKDFYPFDTDAFGDEVKDLIQSFAFDARSTVDALLEQANLIANHLSERYQVDQSIRTELSVAIGDVTAGYTQAITAAVGPDSAIVAQITALQAAIGDDLAEVISTLTAQIDVIDGEVTANTDAITAVSATVGGVSADGTFRIQSVASPGDGWSRIAAQARASTADGWATASWFLDAKSDGTSRFGVVADQFIVTDGTDTAVPFAFTGGKAYLQGVVATSIEVMSAATGARTIITDTLIQVFDANNVERVRLGVWA